MIRSTLRSGRVLGFGALVSVALACGDDGGNPTGPDEDDGSAVVRDVELSVGQTATYAAESDTLELWLPSAAGGREYRLTVQSAATDMPDQFMPMELTRGGGGSASGSISGSRNASGPARGAGPSERGLLIRRRVRADSRRWLVSRGVRPARPSGTASDAGVRTSSKLPSDGPPTEGDTVQFWFAAESPRDTASADIITAVVERVGDRAAIVQDTEAPEPGTRTGGFTDRDFREIAAVFDTLIVPTDSAYFGSPTDIDYNERVYVLFTPGVNELDGTSTRVGGFFLPHDLADSGDGTKDGSGGVEAAPCPASNEAELLYLRSPDDPGGLRPPYDEGGGPSDRLLGLLARAPTPAERGQPGHQAGGRLRRAGDDLAQRGAVPSGRGGRGAGGPGRPRPLQPDVERDRGREPHDVRDLPRERVLQRRAGDEGVSRRAGPGHHGPEGDGVPGDAGLRVALRPLAGRPPDVGQRDGARERGGDPDPRPGGGGRRARDGRGQRGGRHGGELREAPGRLRHHAGRGRRRGRCRSGAGAPHVEPPACTVGWRTPAAASGASSDPTRWSRWSPDSPTERRASGPARDPASTSSSARKTPRHSSVSSSPTGPASRWRPRPGPGSSFSALADSTLEDAPGPRIRHLPGRVSTPARMCQFPRDARLMDESAAGRPDSPRSSVSSLHLRHRESA